MSHRGRLLTAAFLLLAACGPRDPGVAVGPWLTVSKGEAREPTWVHDFGVIRHGETRAEKFFIGNRGPQRVRLLSIQHQCSCAGSTLRVLRDGQPLDRPIHDPPVMQDGGYMVTWLEPGDELELAVTIDTNLRPPRDHKEPAESRLNFQPTEEAGTVVLAYRFEIRSRIRIDAQLLNRLDLVLDLGDFGKDQSAFTVFELAPNDGEDFRILSVEGLDERITLEPKPPLHAGGYRYELRLLPDGRAGPFQRTLVFRTDLPGDYALKLGVEGMATPNLLIAPFGRLDFGHFDWSEPKETFVNLVYRKPNADPGFQVGKIHVEDGSGKDVSSAFTAAIDGGTAQRWSLRLRYAGGLSGTRFDGWVQLKSADPDHASTLVYFSGFPTSTR